MNLARRTAAHAACCLTVFAAVGACGAGADETQKTEPTTSTTAEEPAATVSTDTPPETTQSTTTTIPESQLRNSSGLGVRRVQACLLVDSNRNNRGLYADELSPAGLEEEAVQAVALAERLEESDDAGAG